MAVGYNLAERALLPDSVIRWGIRRALGDRLRESSGEALREEFIGRLADSPIALAPDSANTQHYALPPALFQRFLGPRMKYSCAWYKDRRTSLAAAEEMMLEKTCVRAGIGDGMDILDLGCGWGSLSLWMAERYPGARVTAVSNSMNQRLYVQRVATERGLDNVNVITADMNAFGPRKRFDRICSVEMFEHMRNWPALFRRVSDWLTPEGRFFMHVFCHRHACYPYETSGEENWMARNFFTGGMMPCYDLPRRFPDHLTVEEDWVVSGKHYARTCRDWLRNFDVASEDIILVLESTYGAEHAGMWLQRWRLFLMACEELFAYRGGTEWHVAHYRLAPSA
jgi:cyclopropane-fatty-acyl-phospholipid synthase